MPRLGPSADSLVRQAPRRCAGSRVGIAGQGHGLVLEEHLQARVGLVAPRRVDALQIGDPQGFQVGLPDLAACRFVEPLQHSRIRDRFPAGHRPAAHDSHGLARSGLVHDRRTFGAAVLSGQFQRPCQFIRAAAQLDDDPARRQRPAGFQWRIASRARSSVLKGPSVAAALGSARVPDHPSLPEGKCRSRPLLPAPARHGHREGHSQNPDRAHGVAPLHFAGQLSMSLVRSLRFYHSFVSNSYKMCSGSRGHEKLPGLIVVAIRGFSGAADAGTPARAEHDAIDARAISERRWLRNVPIKALARICKEG